MRRLPAALRLPALRLPLLFVGLALAAGCQDPAGVGIGLIDEDTPSPNVRTLAPTAIDTVAAPLVAAGFADANPADPAALVQTRVLVGAVQDPIYGNARAVAYVDASRPALPSGFGERPVTSVTLELLRDYVYGDTTAALPVELRQVSGTWTPRGLSPDTVLGTGDVLTTATVAAGGERLVRLPLPAAWVEANGALFASDSFAVAFEGLALSTPLPPTPGAVVGFNVAPPPTAASARSRLLVTTARDTVSFAISEVYTRVERDAAAPPPGRLLVQGGTAAGLRAAFDPSSLGPLALAQASLFLPLDRGLAGLAGTFRRPLATQAALVGVRGDVRTSLGALRIGTTGDARTPGSTFLTQIVQDLLLGRRAFDRFEVRLPSSPISLDVLPVALDATPGPRLSLTVVSQPPA